MLMPNVTEEPVCISCLGRASPSLPFTTPRWPRAVPFICRIWSNDVQIFAAALLLTGSASNRPYQRTFFFGFQATNLSRRDVLFNVYKWPGDHWHAARSPRDWHEKWHCHQTHQWDESSNGYCRSWRWRVRGRPDHQRYRTHCYLALCRTWSRDLPTLKFKTWHFVNTRNGKSRKN